MSHPPVSFDNTRHAIGVLPLLEPRPTVTDIALTTNFKFRVALRAALAATQQQLAMFITLAAMQQQLVMRTQVQLPSPWITAHISPYQQPTI